MDQPTSESFLPKLLFVSANVQKSSDELQAETLRSLREINQRHRNGKPLILLLNNQFVLAKQIIASRQVRQACPRCFDSVNLTLNAVFYFEPTVRRCSSPNNQRFCGRHNIVLDRIIDQRLNG